MLLQVCREVCNFFEASSESGDFSLAGGMIALDQRYKAGQHVLLSGSLLVNGVYKIIDAKDGTYTLEGAETDEEWSGKVYGLRIPPDFIKLCDEIKEFAESTVGKPSGLVSESVLGMHSWARATDKNGTPAGWQTIFASRLAPFRRMFTEVSV